MAIRTLSDLNRAFDLGKVHLQRFQKNAGTAHAIKWADCTFASGQPAYDAHVGVPLAFTPCVAQKNDAIWFPSVAAGEERYLHSATLWSNQATYNGPISVQLFDLVGYYPLLDGDSVDLQECDNSLTLPRYSDGSGVFMAIVNHIAPGLQNGLATINYTNSDGVDKTITVDVPNNGQNLVCSGCRTTAGAVSSTWAVPIGSDRGVRRVNSVQYSVAPGGLHCLYLLRPLATMVLGDNLVTAEKEFFGRDGLRMPKIPDGAWLGWFDQMAVGATARTVAWFGNFTFVWG